MFNSLTVVGDERGIYVRRVGVIGINEIGRNVLMIANPSEVLAHDDVTEIRMDLKGDFTVTDQAYTKVLSGSSVTLKVSISCDGTLRFLPNPILFYDNSRARLECTFRLRGKARIKETYILGRAGHGESFNRGDLHSTVKIFSAEELVVHDLFRAVDDSWRERYVMGRNCLTTSYSLDGDGVPRVEKRILESAELEGATGSILEVSEPT